MVYISVNLSCVLVSHSTSCGCANMKYLYTVLLYLLAYIHTYIQTEVPCLPWCCQTVLSIHAYNNVYHFTSISDKCCMAAGCSYPSPVGSNDSTQHCLSEVIVSPWHYHSCSVCAVLTCWLVMWGTPWVISLQIDNTSFNFKIFAAFYPYAQYSTAWSLSIKVMMWVVLP